MIRRAWVPLALFLLALVLRLAGASAVDFPATEVSAYYVGVAENLVQGRGLTSDAIWSHATPPLVAPKPAFDLWLPMATLVAVPVMVAFGPSLWAAQLAHAVLGAALTPLAWAVARDAAERNSLPASRSRWVALGAGGLVAVLGPFLVASAVPDSTTPFAVFAAAAALAVPAALGDRAKPASVRAGVLLGVLLGLAYLSRQEAIFLGLVVLVLALHRGSAERRRALAGVVAGGAAVTLPWLARNLAAFGTLLPGQAVENMLLTRPTDIFAWAERPTVARLAAQGIPGIAANVGDALRNNLVDVLLVSAAPAGVVGLVALPFVVRTPALAGTSPLRVLIVAGAVTFAAITLLFPVATLSGTWLHASGPTLVALAVAAALGADAVVARLGRLRRWARANAWLAPGALIALAVPLAWLQLAVVAAQARTQEARFQEAAGVLAAHASSRAPVVSDHPMWLAEALGSPAVALPDEPPAAVHDLATHYGATLVAVLDDRGPYPEILDRGVPCFEPVPAGEVLRLYRIDIAGCRP